MFGENRRAVIADFGNTAAEGDETVDYGGMTTLRVRAPEYWLPPVTPRASLDVWALGCLSQALFAGRAPFSFEMQENAYVEEHGIASFVGFLGHPADDDLGPFRQRAAWHPFARKLAAASPPGPDVSDVMDIKSRLVRMAQYRGPDDDCLFDLPAACFKWCPSLRASCDNLWQMALFDQERGLVP